MHLCVAAEALRLLLGRRVDIIVMDVNELRGRAQDSFVRNVTQDGRTLAGTSIAELVA